MKTSLLNSGVVGLAVVSLSIGVLGWAAGAAWAGEPPVPAETPVNSGAHSGTVLSRDAVMSFGGVWAFTRPSRDATMGFSLATRVTEVLVAGGQDVKRGQLLLRGDDKEDLVVVKLQEIRVQTDLPVQKAIKAAELAKLEYKKLIEAEKLGGAASPLEIDRARLTSESADIDVDTAKMQQDQEAVQVDRLKARVEKLQIKAPFDGQVDIVLADVGQSTSESDKVVRVVNIDRLWIDAYTPTSLSAELGLKVGDTAWVLLDLPGTPSVRTGKVVEVAPTADSASATRRVRVEMVNKERLVAGVTAWVRFTEPTGEWRARVVASAGVAEKSR